jgi:hypothetical protein
VLVLYSGAWLIFPSIITYDIGAEIINGLASASAPALKTE